MRSSGTLKIERLENQIILGAIKPNKHFHQTLQMNCESKTQEIF